MVNKTKLNYVKLITNYIIKNYKNEVKYIIVFGDSINKTISNPSNLDIAIVFFNKKNATNYEILGDILGYAGDVVDSGDVTITPVCNNLSASYKEAIKNGEILYKKKEKKTTV